MCFLPINKLIGFCIILILKRILSKNPYFLLNKNLNFNKKEQNQK